MYTSSYTASHFATSTIFASGFLAHELNTTPRAGARTTRKEGMPNMQQEDDEAIPVDRLLTILEVMIPLCLADLHKRLDGGEDLAQEIALQEAKQLADDLCVEGMYVVIKPAKTTERGRPASAITKTAKALALIAYHQGYVVFAGERFDDVWRQK